MAAYKAIRYWHRGFHTALWSRARDVLHTDEQRLAIREAEELTILAMKKLEAVFGPAIGKAMIGEVQ